jgi:hypothetical protein
VVPFLTTSTAPLTVKIYSRATKTKLRVSKFAHDRHRLIPAGPLKSERRAKAKPKAKERSSFLRTSDRKWTASKLLRLATSVGVF